MSQERFHRLIETILTHFPYYIKQYKWGKVTKKTLLNLQGFCNSPLLLS